MLGFYSRVFSANVENLAMWLHQASRDVGVRVVRPSSVYCVQLVQPGSTKAKLCLPELGKPTPAVEERSDLPFCFCVSTLHGTDAGCVAYLHDRAPGGWY